ncbi:hypothetical protein FRC01_005991 [Tulasnella sp. 417]|nr:hypothetical protein FRC01_005991 [Tulasnella sp. 417]
MAETLPQQLPEWLSALNKKDRNKVLKQCEKTILCIPNGRRKPLTEKEVVVALGVRRPVVLDDDQTGGYWIRGGDEESQLFLDRLDERGLSGYTTRAVVLGGEDWRRLLDKLEFNGGSHLPNPAGEAIASSSTPQGFAAPQNDYGGRSTQPAGGSANVGGFGSDLVGTSPRSAGFDEAAVDNDLISTNGPELPKRTRKKARQTQDNKLQSPSTTPKKEPPPLDKRFAKLPNELIVYIFELCLEDAVTFEEYHRILAELVGQGGRCSKLLQDAPSFWTKITSTSLHPDIRAALASSRDCLLHIEGVPDPSMSISSGTKQLLEFLSIIKHHKRRWASLSLVFPSELLSKIKNFLAGPARGLETLSLSVVDTAPETGLTLPLGGALGGETGRPLNILGGKAGNLRRVFLNNIPCFWDPSPFTAIIELGLTNAIHLRYTDLIDFLRHSSNFRMLRLVNIKFLGGEPQVVDETVSLPHLTELVLAELTEPIGLGYLYASLETPACEILHLDLRPPVAVLRHPALPARAVPVVQKSLAEGHGSILAFHRNTSTQSASWSSRDEGGVWQSEQPRFHISFRGTDVGLASLFSDFVKRVHNNAGDIGEIVVDVGDSVSGAIDSAFGLGLEALVPNLFPDSFAGLNVVEIRADVVDGYLQHLEEIMVPRESEPWCLKGLRTIRLSAIPEETLETIPHESARCCLEEFIGHIRQKRYGIERDEPILEDGTPMTITLEGTFAIQAATSLALEEGDDLWGIQIKSSNADLVSPVDEARELDENLSH